MKMHEIVFTWKRLSRLETFENAAKETWCKSCLNAENMNAENANSETIFYEAWCMTKIGVA